MFDVIILDVGGNDKNLKKLQNQLPHAITIGWVGKNKTAIAQAIEKTITRFVWVISSYCNYDEFDFNWEPSPWESAQLHCWPSDTFLIPREQWLQQIATIEKIEDFSGMNFTHTPVPLLPLEERMFDIVIMDMRGNADNIEKLQQQFPDAITISWTNSLDALTNVIQQSKSRYTWVISSCCDYGDFNFDWVPSLWEAEQLHCWPSDEQEFGDTFLIPKEQWLRQVKYLDRIEDFNEVNFAHTAVKKLPFEERMFDIIIMDMRGHEKNVEQIQARFPNARVVNFTNTFSTVARAIEKTKTRYTWVISSCCDYSDFNFDWVPSPWEAKQIHCWPSGTQKHGDTFLVPTETWLRNIHNVTNLEQFDINYLHSPVKRLPWAEYVYNDDTLVNVIKKVHPETPYMLFRHSSNPATLQQEPQLWKNPPLVSLTYNNSSCLVPRGVANVVKTQIYDYMFLQYNRSTPGPRLDIVYISNGEPTAVANLNHLFSVAPYGKIHHVRDVSGRVNAYHAAAEASTTPWFFAVFAKLEVNKNFSWDWQPDYWQEPKHYIFHAHNPVNGLQYGHQAMIAYNTKLVLENTGKGLDFTLDQPHEVVPILSGTAHYNSNAWTTWRTAFREIIKLLNNATDVESQHRLTRWKEPGENDPGQWSMHGALDAEDYFYEVAGNFELLRKTYEWDWLLNRFSRLHPQ